MRHRDWSFREEELAAAPYITAQVIGGVPGNLPDGRTKEINCSTWASAMRGAFIDWSQSHETAVRLEAWSLFP